MPREASTAALLELAALVRGALVLADGLGLSRVALDLDSALNGIVALDDSGQIAPQPFGLDDGPSAEVVRAACA